MEKHVQEHPACLKTWVCTPPVRMKHHKPESWKKRGTLAGVVVVNTEHSLFVFFVFFAMPALKPQKQHRDDGAEVKQPQNSSAVME